MAEWRKDRRTLAVQVRDLIWTMIQEEHYHPGDRLPSEQELVGRFGISRGALREALKILEEERVVLCQHGIGRFVAPSPSDILSEDITRLKSTTEFANSLGFTFSKRVLSARQEPAAGVICTHLDLPEGVPVMVLERVFNGPEGPIIYSIDIFPRSLVSEDMDMEHFQGSLLQAIEQNGQNRLEYSKTVLRAVILDEELSRRIGTTTCSPWILLEQVNYNGRDRPILYSKDYHCGEKFQFRVLRRRR